MANAKKTPNTGRRAKASKGAQRSKATKKSTGAPAPRRQLVGQTPSLQSTRVTRSRTAARTELKPSGDSDNYMATREGQPDAPYKYLEVVQEGDPSDLRTPCILCHNGDEVWICALCDGSMCTTCVRIEHPEKHQFVCLACWPKTEAYPHEVNGAYAVRSNPAPLDASPVVVIEFRLIGMKAEGHPSRDAYLSLRSYLGYKAAHIVVPFDFDKEKDVEGAIEELIHVLQNRFDKACRFLVTLQSHADPDRGDIHVVPNNRGASELEDVLASLLPDNLRRVLMRGGSPSENLFILFGELFHEVVAFEQERFQPDLSVHFIRDTVRSVFCFKRRSVMTVIGDHHVFGAHTGVVVFKEGSMTQYIWAHPVKRPFGQKVGPLCHHCKKSAGFVKKASDNHSGHQRPRFDVAFKLVCKACGVSTPYSMPDGVEWVDRAPGQDHHGAWLMRVVPP
ncbi:hypothetical protein NMY22_g1131 [Coprinellus aureogranulatus]|nr:hypothetical protein NMY22_g1131 [Coprinellus aureogranulatus]